MDQSQFLNLLSAEEAWQRLEAVFQPKPLGEERVPLSQALGRVLAQDVVAQLDVPLFDRSNLDGFAVQAADTFGATEIAPRQLTLNNEVLHCGVLPAISVTAGYATPIATGGVLPRGANAVVMVEDTLPGHTPDKVRMVRPVAPGQGVSFAGTDIGAGETVLFAGTRLTSRETGVLAALGMAHVPVWRQPRVAILSTGDEIVRPGQPLAMGQVYDTNGTLLAHAVQELGCLPVSLPPVPDDEALVEAAIVQALAADVVLLSGGTSKGAGDVNYRVAARMGEILAHGVALKPGKPLCLARVGHKPLVVLPGFPTSAIFTFHHFVAPLLRRMAGLPPHNPRQTAARLAQRVLSDKGRTEYLLVNLSPGPEGLAAYPVQKGSGNVTAFAKADGFVTIPRLREQVEAGETLQVSLLGPDLEAADLVVMGSHCPGLDLLLGRLSLQGWRCKFMAVGSQGGLAAVRRGECDLAGMHLYHPPTQTYNLPYLEPGLRLLRGYGRKQGLVYRHGDVRFAGKTARQAVRDLLGLEDCLMVNRNRGSGTRVLLDDLLEGQQPPGYFAEANTHNAVAAAVAQGRADWGMAVDMAARRLGLEFIPWVDENFDFVIPQEKAHRPAVKAFEDLLSQAQVREELAALGLNLPLLP